MFYIIILVPDSVYYMYGLKLVKYNREWRSFLLAPLAINLMEFIPLLLSNLNTVTDNNFCCSFNTVSLDL